MKRAAIAAAWILGSTVPLLVATVFLLGCCVLPFHRVMHRLMPLCNMAVNVMSGHLHGDGATPAPIPAKEKQEPVKRVMTTLSGTFRLTADLDSHLITPTASSAYRSYISLGAIRCDQDVGLHLLVHTLLI